MKRIIFFISLTLTATILISCSNPSVGIIGGSDGPTAVLISNDTSDEIKKLYELKTDYVGDNSAVGNILSQASDIFGNLPENSSRTFEITEKHGLIINYKVDNRSNYRYFDYGYFDKITAVLFSLIGNLEDVRYRFYDDFSDRSNSDTAFLSLYYDINRLSSRQVTAEFTQDRIKSAANNKDSFENYIEALIRLYIPVQDSPFLDAVYSKLSEHEQIVTNSLVILRVEITENKLTDFQKYLPEGMDFTNYIGKKLAFHMSEIYNYKEKAQSTHLFLFEGTDLLAHGIFADEKQAYRALIYLRETSEGEN